MHLARDGHGVAVNYTANRSAADEVVEAITGAGGNAIALQADVGETDAVAAMFHEIEGRLGRVAILVNNAGIARDDLLMRMSPEAWDEVIQTNLRSVYLCTRAAMRGMLRQKWGRIISVSSVSGISGNPGQANYAASKAAIIGFSKSVAREIGSRSITVNVVAPGFIETDMTEHLGADIAEEAAQRIALGRLGKPEEIAAAVGYLASDDAAYVTGQTIVVDGGLSINGNVGHAKTDIEGGEVSD